MAISFFDKLAAFSRDNDGVLDGPAITWFQKHAIVIAALASCAVIVRYYRQTLVQESQPLKNDILPSTADIVPLQGFRWDETEPLAYRPFKSQYHLTMGKTPRSYDEKRLVFVLAKAADTTQGCSRPKFQS
jgi:hypothetical protein